MRPLRLLALSLAVCAFAMGCQRSAAPEGADGSSDPQVPNAAQNPAVPGQPGAPAAAAPEPPPTRPFAVTGIEMGKAIDSATNKVSAPTDTFSPNDMFYASVATDGNVLDRALTARWSYQSGQVFGTETKTINSNGPKQTEFHVSKTSPWPLGAYKVEIEMNGAVVETREFDVVEGGVDSTAPSVAAPPQANTSATPTATPPAVTAPAPTAAASPPAATPARR